MRGGPGWSADGALDAVLPAPWTGDTWRNHGRRYQATDPGDTRIVSGRYHRAPDLFPAGRCWPALYVSLTDGGAIAELTRRLEPTNLAGLNNRRLTRMRVALSIVIDLRDPSVIGLATSDLVDEYDYSVTQAIAEAAVQRRIEGLLVPAASLLAGNLVVFVDNLTSSSTLEPLDWIDPKLYVPRP